MDKQEKTFKVNCPECNKPFHVRFSLEDPDAEGTGEVRITCMYCNKSVMIEIPRPYIPKGDPTYKKE